MKTSAREEPIGEIRRSVDISDLLAKLPRPYEAMKGDSEYFDEHQEELVELYPDQWVAIVGHEIIAHAAEPQRLNRLLGKHPLGGLSPLVQFVEKTPRNLSL
jgi:hypothetical protein